MPTIQKTTKTMNNSQNWYQIKSKSSSEAEILIYEQIGENWDGGGIGYKNFARDLKALGDIKKITLRINSPGGCVFEGNAIYNTLKAHKAKKIMIVDGLAASIASVILMAGDEIIMPTNAMIMIHDPWTLAVGNSADMRKAADMLDKVKEAILTSYRRSGQDDATIAQMMTEETWMTAEEAVDFGFADKTTEAVQAAAMAFDLSNYRNVPDFLKSQVINLNPPATPGNKAVNSKNKGEIDTMPITLEELKNEAPDLITQLKNEGKQEALSDIEKIKNEARNEGAELERKRIQAIEDLHTAGYEKIVSEFKYDGKTQAPDVAMKILAAQKQEQSNVLRNLKEDAPKPVNADVQNADDAQNGSDPLKDKTPLSLDEAKKIYTQDERVKKQFTSPENFYYYRKSLK